MRMDRTQGRTAADLVNQLPVPELERILRRFGEEGRARRISRAIADARPLRSTRRLADVVEEAVGGRRGARLHPATKTFQALRIAVNEELEGLDSFLEEAVEATVKGGRIVGISYHSLEDRILKRTFRCLEREKGMVTVLTRKPLRPSAEEVEGNPRARSAKLRAAERV
jgi:16S rRNA (cytosine1402-N4)-methyltransferase